MVRPLKTLGGRHEMVMLVVLVVVAAGLIGYLVLGHGAGSTAVGPNAATPSGDAATSKKPATLGPLGDLARHQADDPLALGRPNAPATMVMFSDYRCPFCAKFSRDTEQQIVDQYVNDGQLRIEWHDFPSPGLLPDRPRPEMPLPRHPVIRPHRPRQIPLGDALETRTERHRHPVPWCLRPIRRQL